MLIQYVVFKQQSALRFNNTAVDEFGFIFLGYFVENFLITFCSIIYSSF